MEDVMSSLAFWEGHVVQSYCERVDGSLLIELPELGIPLTQVTVYGDE